jgi:hypothetical protein
MKTVRMSLISWQGEIVNEWSIPFTRRDDAINHAMDRAEQEGHAGVLWSVFNRGKTQEIAFDSHNPRGVEAFAKAALPYMTATGFDVDRLLGESRERVTNIGYKHHG